MCRKLLVLALAVALSPVVLGDVIVDDNFDDGDIETNTTGIGTGFNTESLTGGSVTEEDSFANLINTGNGAARAAITSKEGAAIGAGITRFEFRGVTFSLSEEDSSGATARQALGVRLDDTAEDADGGQAAGFWIQFENDSLLSAGNGGGWNGTSVLMYQPSGDNLDTPAIALATWSFQTLNWDSGTQNFTPVLNITLDLSATGYSLVIEGDTLSNVTGSLSNTYQAAGITNELTTGHAFVFNQTENDAINISVDRIVMTEGASGPELPSQPSPADGATDVLRNAMLSWTAGEFAQTHNVYFGTDFDDVNSAEVGSPLLVSQGQSVAAYIPANALAYGQTYYWRVDEVNAPSSPGSYRGPVWSFTVEPYSVVVADVNVTTSTAIKTDAEPQKMVNGSGLLEDGGHSNVPAQMWQSDLPAEGVVVDFAFDRLYKLDEALVWNYNHIYEVYLGFSTKNMKVEYAAEPNEWVTLGEFELSQGPGTADIVAQSLDFGGAAVQYVRFTITSSYSGTGVGLSEVRFMYIPTFARQPQPASGSLGVAPDVDLSWRPGREAVTHQVHIGTDADAVASGQSLAAVSTMPSYSGSLLGLTLGEKYYWKITEVNFAATPSQWDSEIWDFNTPDYLVVDDMESYDDTDNRIYFSWVDGLDDSTNGGSQVGPDDPPYASQDVVHSGNQAMLFQFGKSGKTTSEADLTLGGMDMTLGGAKTLVVWFRGQVGNGTPQLYAKINNTTINYTGSAGSLAAPVWKQWNIELSGLGNAARNVTTLSLGVSGAGAGTLYFDDIRLYQDAGPQTGNAVNPGTTGLMAYYPMNDSLADASGKGYNGTVEVGASYAAGLSNYGRALVLDGTSGVATLPIGPVLQSSDSITVASWFRVDTSNNWARLFDFNDGTTDVYMFFAPTNGGSSRFAITTASSAGEAQVSGPPITADGQWHHMAATIDGTAGELKLYIDGTLAESTTTETLPSDLGNTTANYIGQSAWDDPLFTGAVDEFTIFNRALSAGEVQYLVGDR